MPRWVQFSARSIAPAWQRNPVVLVLAAVVWLALMLLYGAALFGP